MTPDNERLITDVKVIKAPLENSGRSALVFVCMKCREPCVAIDIDKALLHNRCPFKLLAGKFKRRKVKPKWILPKGIIR